MKTKTLFRVWLTDSREVFALFPRDPGTRDPYTCTSYAHVGQHSSADPQLCIRASRPAKPSEYRALARELRRIGYKLDIRQRTSRHDLEARKRELAR